MSNPELSSTPRSEVPLALKTHQELLDMSVNLLRAAQSAPPGMHEIFVNQALILAQASQGTDLTRQVTSEVGQTEGPRVIVIFQSSQAPREEPALPTLKAPEPHLAKAKGETSSQKTAETVLDDDDLVNLENYAVARGINPGTLRAYVTAINRTDVVLIKKRKGGRSFYSKQQLETVFGSRIDQNLERQHLKKK